MIDKLHWLSGESALLIFRKKMQALDLSKPLEFMYQTTWRHHPQDRSNLQRGRRKNLKSHLSIIFNVANGLQCFLNMFHNFKLNGSGQDCAALWPVSWGRQLFYNLSSNSQLTKLWICSMHRPIVWLPALKSKTRLENYNLSGLYKFKCHRL
jgi:hypothetical protein